MAAEIIWTFSTGRSGYAVVRSSSGTIHNRVSDAFEAYDQANFLTYQRSGREQSSGRIYVADFPSTAPMGYYNIEARDQVGGSGLQSDMVVAVGELWWNGSAVITAVDLRSGHQAVSGVLIASGGVLGSNVSGVLIASGGVTAANVSGVQPASGFATTVQVSGFATTSQLEAYLPVRLIKNTAFSGFVFKMDLSGTIGLPLTSGNLTAQRTSGALKGFANLAANPAEIGNGWYRQNYTAADLNDDAIGFKFTENSGRGVQRDFTVITQRSG